MKILLLAILSIMITTSCVSRAISSTDGEIIPTTGETMQLEELKMFQLKIVFYDNKNSFPDKGSYEFKSLKCGGDFQVEGELKSKDEPIILKLNKRYGDQWSGDCVGNRISISRDLATYQTPFGDSGIFDKTNEKLKYLSNNDTNSSDIVAINSLKKLIAMRSAPESTASVRKYLEHNEVLTKISTQGDWVQVKLTKGRRKGWEGWIHNELNVLNDNPQIVLPSNDGLEDIGYNGETTLYDLISGNTLTSSHESFCLDENSSKPCLIIAILEPGKSNEMMKDKLVTIIYPDKQTIVKRNWGWWAMPDAMNMGLHTGIISLATARGRFMQDCVRINSSKDMFRVIQGAGGGDYGTDCDDINSDIDGDGFIEIYIHKGHEKKYLSEAVKAKYKTIDERGQISPAQAVLAGTLKTVGKAMLAAAADSSSISPHSSSSPGKPNSNYICSFICYENYALAPDVKSEQTIHVSASDESSAEKTGYKMAEQVCVEKIGVGAKIYSRFEGDLVCKKQR